MRYSEEVIEEVRMKNDIVDVIGEHVRLKRSGSNYFGLCPFHNEKTPSFSVTPHRQTYYCFGCHKSGDVFSFKMEYDNCSFTEAVESLAGRAGVILPAYTMSASSRAERDKKEELLAVYKSAAGFYYYQLLSPSGEKAKAYFSNRGITEEIIRQYGLGYAGTYKDALYKYLRSKGYDDALLKESGLFTYSERSGFADRFFHRVMFPITDVRGRVIGFGGRVMGSGEPKYLNSPETMIFNKRRNLFGLQEARRHGKERILLCEGYMDVLSMHQAGMKNAVASLGTALTPQQAMLLKRYTKEVCLLYDSDGAGRAAAVRAVPMLHDAGLAVKVASLTPYKDPDELVKAEGLPVLEERVTQAQNGFLYTIDALQSQFDMKDPQGKTDFTKAIAVRLLTLEDEIERGNYLETICRNYRIEEDAMKRLVAQQAAAGVRSYPRDEIEPRQERQSVTRVQNAAVERMMIACLIRGNAYALTKDLIGPDDFCDPLLKKVADILYAHFPDHPLREVQILNTFSDPSERETIAQVFYETDAYTDEEARQRAFTDAVLHMVNRGNQARMDAWKGDEETLRSWKERKALVEHYENDGIVFPYQDNDVDE